MYILEYLKQPEPRPKGVGVEYRLACSGEFYNRKVLTSDWRKSDITRILLQRPFFMSVVSRPFESYPQELCVRMTPQQVTEEGGSPSARSSRTFLPDDEIVEDFCSILTLLSRRLISPVAKTRERHAEPYAAQWYGGDVPMPTLNASKVVTWPKRPATVITTATGQTVEPNDPPPVGVDAEALKKFLTELPANAHAKEIMHAAQQYRSALELINDRPDTAYLALVSVVESLADISISNYEPDDAEKLTKHYGGLQKTARKMGLDDMQVKDLVLAACKEQRWLARKFVKFCVTYCGVEPLRTPDRVFILNEYLIPSENEIEQYLAKIYSARSKNLHTARPFPPGVGIGMSPWIKWKDLPLDPMGRPEIPPAPWFERIVSIAARNFLLQGRSVPFVEHDDG